MRKSIYAFFAAATLCGALALPAQDSPAKGDAAKGDAAKGKEVFEQCAGCHNADSAEKKMGPGLKGLFAKEKMNNGAKPTYDSVLKQINEGGNGMPAYQDLLSDQEKKDLMAYLQTL